MHNVAECKNITKGNWILVKGERHGEFASQTPYHVTRVEKARLYIQERNEKNELVDCSYKLTKSVAFVFETEAQAKEAAEKAKEIYEQWATEGYKLVVEQTGKLLNDVGGLKFSMA
jgi:phage gpG-like protein